MTLYIVPLCIFTFYRITITTEGKYSAIENGVLPSLVALLTDASSEVRLNALKVFAANFLCQKGGERGEGGVMILGLWVHT